MGDDQAADLTPHDRAELRLIGRVRELEAEVARLREALRIVAEYDGEWVEGDPLVIRDLAREALRDG